MHLQAWLVRIMRSLFSREYRRGTRRPDEWLGQDITGWELDAYYRHTQQPDPNYERFIGAPFTDEVRRAMSALPDCLSRALYHAYVEGFAHKDIALAERRTRMRCACDSRTDA
jgi:DNA-directed RNA polymerase specialized sigma24 family protein